MQALENNRGRAVPPGLLRLSYVTTMAMFVVIVMGALVTNSGSAEGCGSSWPLCDGEWLPAMNVHSIIEYSHRLVSGIAGLLVAAMAVWALRRFGWHPEIRWLMWGAVAFVLIQAVLGAMAVVWPQPSVVMALHFGVSLTAFAAVLLPTVIFRQMNKGEDRRSLGISDRLKRGAWLVTLYTYALVYSGAYVRHTNAHLACLDWPLCDGRLIPPLEGAIGIQFAHRLAAAVGTALLGWLAWQAAKEREQRPDLHFGASLSFALIALQVLSGAVVVLSRLTLTSMMIHSVIVTLLFGALSYVCLQSLAPPKVRPSD